MPRSSTLRNVLLLAALTACVGQGSRPAPPPAGPVAQGPAPGSPEYMRQPGRWRNLQILPDTISRQTMQTYMRTFTSSLDVNCLYCHVGREGGPPDSVDFASDEKGSKHTARGMMRMVQALNQDIIPDIPGVAGDGGQVPVSCMTCHRGARRPLMLEDTLMRVYRSQGADSVAATYRALRTADPDRFTFHWHERPLLLLVQRLMAEGRTAAELQPIFEEYATSWPQSPFAAFELGRIVEAQGNRTRALELYLRAISIAPNYPGARERVTALGGTLPPLPPPGQPPQQPQQPAPPPPAPPAPPRP